MRTLVAFTALLSAWTTLCGAQTIEGGTFQLSGVTSAAGNRQTISTQGSTDQFIAGQVGFTSLTFGFEGTYYLTPKFGIGVLVSYQRLSFDAPDRAVLAELAGGYYGPFTQVRIPLSDRTAFVLAGSAGGIRTSVINQNTGLGDNISVHPLGRYWLAGGGLSFSLASNASFDAGVRYQSSTFTGVPGQNTRATGAGLLVGLGLSLYLK